MQTTAVLLTAPQALGLAQLPLHAPKADELVVDVRWSGISTGTEKLFYTGEMPPFPGMGFPLVPGYEASGEVVEAGADCALKPGHHVFVPGANCYDGAFGLFGGASARLVTPEARVTQIDCGAGETGALLALAATARHALAAPKAELPELIVGHGVLGRLLARLTVALGGAPTVWEIDPARQSGADGYDVVHPDADPRHDYTSIYDASGQDGLLNTLVTRIAKGGEIVLAGFYRQPISFAFPPAFMKEARLRIAAEWAREDLHETRRLVEDGALSLDGLITHRAPASDAPSAYATAFDDAECLKMILSWEIAA